MDIAPHVRCLVAKDPIGPGKTVIRGGFGMSYNVRARSGQECDLTNNAPTTNSPRQFCGNAFNSQQNRPEAAISARLQAFPAFRAEVGRLALVARQNSDMILFRSPRNLPWPTLTPSPTVIAASNKTTWRGW